MSTGYFYGTEHSPAHVYNHEMRMSMEMRQKTQMWRNDSPGTVGASSLALSRSSLDEYFMLPSVDLQPLNLKKEYYGYHEPNSVLDMHLAPSPGSSPSRSSAYGSPVSSARSVPSYSRQHSFSSTHSDSPRSHVSYLEEKRSPFSRGPLFPSNVGPSDMTSSWIECLSEPHDQIGILDDLSGLDCETVLASASANGQVLENTRAQDLQYYSGDLDLGGLESMMMLPESNPGMLAHPLCQLLDEQDDDINSLSQLLDSSHHHTFENFHPNPLHHDPSSIGLTTGCSDNPRLYGVQQCGKFSGFHQQQQETEVELEPQSQEESGLYLVQLLLGCAEAIEEGNYQLAKSLSSRLGGMGSPFGDAMQRIAVYFGEALAERIEKAMITDTTYIHTTMASSQPKSTRVLTPLSLDSHVAYQTFYQILPFVKFAHFTANQAILEAVQSDERIHLVDLDIGQGLQWPSLIQSLALRDPKQFHLRITGVGPDLKVLQQTGRRLCEFAGSLQVALEYHAIEEKCLENLDAGILRVHLGESLAVNCANVLNGLLGDPGALDTVLRLINGLNPVVVAVVEVESNNNSPSYTNRFMETLQHYSALFDCLEATLSRPSTERQRIEKLYFASAIKNIMAGDGPHRIARHARTEGWQMWFRQAGFRDLPLSGYALYQAKLLLGLYNGAYKLTEDGSALNLGWQDTPIITVSAWACNN